MRLIVNTGFAVLTTLLYGFVAAVILCEAMRDPGYSPSDSQTTLFGLTSGAVVAFMTTQLGLAAANDQTGPGASVKAAISGDASKGRGDLILAFVVLAFVLVGLWSVVLWAAPGMLAAPAASEFVALQAKAFIGIVIAGFAAVASSVGGA